MKIQGDMILHAFDYLHRKRGSNGIKAVQTELGFELSTIHPEGWYPLDWYVDALNQITNVVNKKGYSVASRIGYDRSKHVGFLEVQKDKLTPMWVFQKVKTNWSMFYSSGLVEVTQTGDMSLRFEIYEYDSHPLFCERSHGFVTGLLREVCGYKEGTVDKDKCITKGDDCCGFKVKW